MGEVEPYDWRCHSATTPASSFGEFVSLKSRSFQRKSRFLEVLSVLWQVQALLLSEKACFPVTFLIRLLLEHSISHQLLSRHSLAGGPGVRNAVVNPPCPGFSASLILTAKSQPCLLPLIAWVAQRVPCPLGTSNLQLSGSFTIIDMQLKDYLVTLEGFCFVCSWTSIPACIK